jgi:hypothetical protein
MTSTTGKNNQKSDERPKSKREVFDLSEVNAEEFAITGRWADLVQDYADLAEGKYFKEPFPAELVGDEPGKKDARQKHVTSIRNAINTAEDEKYRGTLTTRVSRDTKTLLIGKKLTTTTGEKQSK